MVLGEGNLIGMKLNKKDYYISFMDFLYWEIICKKMYLKFFSGFVFFFLDCLGENDSWFYFSMEFKKLCFCEYIRLLMLCEYDDCICEICDELFEKCFGKMDGYKMVSFYKLWDWFFR